MINEALQSTNDPITEKQLFSEMKPLDRAKMLAKVLGIPESSISEGIAARKPQGEGSIFPSNIPGVIQELADLGQATEPTGYTPEKLRAEQVKQYNIALL